MTGWWLSRYLSMMYVCWSSTELISILHHSARFAPDAAVQTLGCQGFQASLLETGYAGEMLDYTELLRKWWWDYINICALQCMILKRSPSNTSCSESLELRCLEGKSEGPSNCLWWNCGFSELRPQWASCQQLPLLFGPQAARTPHWTWHRASLPQWRWPLHRLEDAHYRDPHVVWDLALAHGSIWKAAMWSLVCCIPAFVTETQELSRMCCHHSFLQPHHNWRSFRTELMCMDVYAYAARGSSW